MKSLKMSNLTRLISFMAITVLLVCIIGFAVNGKQNDNPPTQNDGITAENNGGNDNTDIPTNGNINENSPPKFISTATGLEISEEKFYSNAIAYVTDPNKTLYGISLSDISIEFGVECGNSRMLSYIQGYNSLWKVGSIEKTRDYISSMSEFFGGIIISYGNDDLLKYSAFEAGKNIISLKEHENSHYIENAVNIYTGKDMINNTLNASQITEAYTYNSMPFDFIDGALSASAPANATNIIIPYSNNNVTVFKYSSESRKYSYFKSDNKKIDMLTGSSVEYRNIFILFANSITYEMSVGSEIVYDTLGNGSGYYISDGKIAEFKWCVDEKGALVFYKLNGEKLAVNKGNSYISYYKTTDSANIIYH